MTRVLNTICCCALCVMMSCCAVPFGDRPPRGTVSFPADSLRSGDFVCRLGDGFFSDIFRKYSGGDERFSHIGIFHEEGGRSFVIHAEASELTGIGSVRMDSLSDFLDHAYDYDFYHVKNDTIRARIDSFASCYLKRNTPFDMAFDITSDSTLYCSELVAVSVNRAMGDSCYVPTHVILGKGGYRIDDILSCGVVERSGIDR